jgi:DNA-binding NarL/FixJ family response regulator
MPIRVAIVEDNAGICRELQLIVAGTDDLLCVAVCRNADAALARIPASQPDVVMMDIQLSGRSGIDCTARLKPLLPRAQILMFTISDERDQILAALAAGAVGYILKSSTPGEIVEAIRAAYNNGAPMTAEVARKVIESFHSKPAPAGFDISSLTAREIDVVRLLAKGLLDKQIADELRMSVLTVNSHLKHIYAKLGVHSRTEVVIKCLNSL